MNEQWKIIKEFPNYAVSSLGRIKRTGASPGVMVNRILNHNVGKTGYHSVMFYSRINGRKKLLCHRKYVHRLVAENFIYKIDGRDYINHLDGNKSNNCTTNLAWVTVSENHFHAFKLGLRKTYRHSSLTEKAVIGIRNHPKYHGYRKDVAKKFNVTVDTVSSIVSFKRWKHVPSS